MFLVFLQICDQRFNSETSNYVYLRLWNIAWFLQFLSNFQWVLKTKSKLTIFYSKFGEGEADFCSLLVLVCCCAASQYSGNNGIFLEFFGVLRVNKSEITGENTFDGDHFEIEANHDSSQDKETLFLLFLQICDQCLNP